MSRKKTQTAETRPGGEYSFEMSKFITFRDRKACERVRSIKKAEITKHPNPEFRIRVIEDPHSFYFEFALDLVTRLRQSLEAGKKFVAILPVGPTPQYDLATRMVNDLHISCRHVHTFNMDEYADESGNPPPLVGPAHFRVP